MVWSTETGWSRIGRGHQRSPREPVDIWLGSAPEVGERIGSVHPQLVGEPMEKVLVGLRAAGVDGPADALAGLARRISATPKWMLAPVGTEFVDEKGRKRRVHSRVHAQVRTELRKPK